MSMTLANDKPKFAIEILVRTWLADSDEHKQNDEEPKDCMICFTELGRR